MNTGIFYHHLRREYWENRLWLFVLPTILSVLLIILSLLLTKYVTALDISERELIVFHSEHGQTRTLDFSVGAQPHSADGATPEAQSSESEDENIGVNLAQEFDTDFDESPIGMLAVYLASAWVVSLFYFSACLYTDRKDNSILFWKSLPVPERDTVLAKLCFGVFGFTGVALVMGWLCWLIICLIGVVTPMGELIFDEMTGSGVLSALYIAPLMVVLGFIRGLPIIGLLMLLSALAKRSPLMMGVVLIGLVLLAEKLLFSTAWVYHWLSWHLPLISLDTEVAEGRSLLAYHVMELLRHPFMLISGVLVGVGAIGLAVWCREHRFEI